MSTRRERSDRRHRFDAVFAARATRVREPAVYADRPSALTREHLVKNLLANMTPPDVEMATAQADALIACSLVTITADPS